MCLSALYLDGEAPENLVMERVALVDVEEGGWLRVVDLFGTERRIRGALTNIDLMDNKVFIASEA